MSCCHADFAAVEGSDRGFTVGMPTFTFGRGRPGRSRRQRARARDEARRALHRSASQVRRVRRDREGVARGGRRRRHRLRRSRHRAHRRVVPGCGALRRRRPIRRLRLRRRRLGDGHVQGGESLRDAPGGVHDLRERADRRRAEGAGAGEAAHRVSDDVGHRFGDHRHRDLHAARDQREDRHHLAPPDPRRRADRSDGCRDAAEERRRGDRLRLHEPRARIADGARLHAAPQSGEGREPAGVAGCESVLRHARDRGAEERREVSSCARSTTRRTPRRAPR